MRIRGWLFLCLHCAAVCGCLMILAAHWGHGSPGGHGLTAFFFYVLSPWLLPVTSLIAWRKARQWRRMKAARLGTPTLSRGEITFALPDHRPGLLERLSVLSLMLAGVTIGNRLGWSEPGWLLALTLALWLTVRLARASVLGR